MKSGCDLGKQSVPRPRWLLSRRPQLGTSFSMTIMIIPKIRYKSIFPPNWRETRSKGRLRTTTRIRPTEQTAKNVGDLVAEWPFLFLRNCTLCYLRSKKTASSTSFLGKSILCCLNHRMNQVSHLDINVIRMKATSRSLLRSSWAQGVCWKSDAQVLPPVEAHEFPTPVEPVWFFSHNDRSRSWWILSRVVLETQAVPLSKYGMMMTSFFSCFRFFGLI